MIGTTGSSSSARFNSAMAWSKRPKPEAKGFRTNGAPTHNSDLGKSRVRILSPIGRSQNQRRTRKRGRCALRPAYRRARPLFARQLVREEDSLEEFLRSRWELKRNCRPCLSKRGHSADLSQLLAQNRPALSSDSHRSACSKDSAPSGKADALP